MSWFLEITRLVVGIIDKLYKLFHTGDRNTDVPWEAVEPDELTSNEPIVGTMLTLENERADNWTEHEPPEILTSAWDIDSDVIKALVKDSIERVKSQIAEKEKLRAEAEINAQRGEGSIKKDAGAVTTGINLGDNLNAQTILSKVVKRKPVAAPGDSVDSPSPAVAVPPRKSRARWVSVLLRRLNNGERAHRSAKVASQQTNSNATVECVSCLDNYASKDVVKGPCHSYCHECFALLITTACENEQQWPPKCCLNPIPSSIISPNISPELGKRYKERSDEWDTPMADRIYCSQPDCSMFIRPSGIDRSSNNGKCRRNHDTCLLCRGPQHNGRNCPQDRDLIRTEELAEQEGWKRCYQCRAFVEHKDACQHMTCRCGAHFCYVCGAQWRTCRCTMSQLDQVKSEASARRRQRQAREAQEDAAAAEAIRLVEEFVREEARKAELLRQERQRRNEQRRQRELEAWIEREESRRKRVENKFRSLRAVLSNLHGRQRSAINQDHDNCRVRIDNLKEKHRVDNVLMSQALAKLTERKCAFHAEYTARLTEQRRIESEYSQQLREYWAGKAGGDERIEISLVGLKRKMDQRFSDWKTWMDNDLDKYEKELMGEAQRRLDNRSTLQRQEACFKKKQQADLEWVRAVMQERDKMLAEMEVEEVENGGEDIAWIIDSFEFGEDWDWGPEASTSNWTRLSLQ